MTRIRLGFGLLAVIFAGVASLATYSVAAELHTRTITKTKQVQSTFGGNPVSLAAFLRAKQAKSVPCPTQLQGAVCFIFQSATWYIFAAFPPGQ